MSSKLPMSACLGLVLVLAVATGPLDAQQAYEPPVIQFAGDGISIVEAVRLSLAHDPNIKLQEADVSFNEGVVQQEKGFFDLTLLGSVFYEYREQEMRESRKKLEREKREEYDKGISEGEEFEDDMTELRATLRQARNAPPGDPTVNAIPDPVIRAQLLMLDSLIAQARRSERQQLLDLRNQIIDDYLEQITDGLTSGLEALDDARIKRAQLGDVPNDEVFYQANISFQLDKLLHNGISVRPFFDGKYDGTNFKGKPISEEWGGKGIEDLITFRVGVEGTVPLLRGSGAETVAAAERAAMRSYDASYFASRHQAAVSVLNTIRAYWGLRSSQETVEVTTRSVTLQERLVQLTQALIEADELPRVELARVRASETRSRARLDGAERTLHEARVNLATVMGLTVTGDEATLPLAAEGFPEISESSLAEQDVMRLSAEAETLRQDLQATHELEEAGRILTRGAQLDLKSRLDLSGGVWATALGESSFSKAVERWVGPSGNVELEYEKPFGNNFFRGRLVQQQADFRQRQISSVDLERKIKLGIVRDSRSLQEAVERVRQVEQSVEYYQATIDAEIERYQTGDSTLVDTILTEDQQTGALLSLVLARKEYANLVARLRFESGLLVGYRQGQSVVTRENLVTVPGQGSRSEP